MLLARKWPCCRIAISRLEGGMVVAFIELQGFSIFCFFMLPTGYHALKPVIWKPN